MQLSYILSCLKQVTVHAEEKKGSLFSVSPSCKEQLKRISLTYYLTLCQLIYWHKPLRARDPTTFENKQNYLVYNLVLLLSNSRATFKRYLIPFFSETPSKRIVNKIRGTLAFLFQLFAVRGKRCILFFFSRYRLYQKWNATRVLSFILHFGWSMLLLLVEI